MSTLKITDAQVKALKPQSKLYDKGFGGGLYIRITPDGRKVARFRYQIAGVTSIITLGEYGRGAGQMSLAQISAEYTKQKGLLAQNKNPADEREILRQSVQISKQERLRRENALTVGQLFERFLENYKGRKGQISEKTKKEYKQHLRGFYAKWSSNLVEELPFLEIKGALGRLGKKKPVMANRLAATLSIVLGWAFDEGYIKSNPVPPRFKPGGAECTSPYKCGLLVA